MTQTALDFEVMPPRLAVRAMRDSGYKNAAYAIAELVDNAVQAESALVEILCEEREEFVRERRRQRVSRIAVVDDGCGMDRATLRAALQFGNGSRLEDRSGIGRFGMGLPNSSLSQAMRVEVYSWQDGVGKAHYSYLDVEEIETGKMRAVPEPRACAVPSEWIEVSESMRGSRSGTLVVWSRLDRCDWRTARAIFRNSEYTIGRVYRRMLVDSQMRIRMASFLEDSYEIQYDESVLPNDPLYLTEGSSCPEPWDSRGMFEEFGEPSVFRWRDDSGTTHSVRVRCAIAKREARTRDQAGALPHGKHAHHNIGVSVVRAARELELQVEWCIGYDPRERWWGIEVEFPPGMDEVFGVTNNKQNATALAEFAKLDVAQIAEREGYKSEQELRAAWDEDNDPRLVLVDVKNAIESNLRTIRGTIKAQRMPSSKRRRHDPESPENVGTKAIARRREDGYEGESDRQSLLPASVRTQQIRDGLIESGLEEGEASARAKSIVDDGRKYEFHRTDLQSPEFFSVRRKGGALLVLLNTGHPAYDKLVTFLEDDLERVDVDELRARLQRSYDGLKLLLEAWARYEDELSDGPRREKAQEARVDWGIIAREFFRED